MGLVGPGFVGAHHIDAVRRLGFVDVVAVAASSEASARRKADALGVPKAYGSFEALVADPDVHVVHNTTPNYLHVPVILAALGARQARHLRQAAGDDRRRRAAAARRRDAGRRRPRGDVQLSRQPAGAAGARDDRRRRARAGALRPRRLPAGLAARADRLLVAPRAGEGRRELRGRRHRLALVRSRAARHRPAHRRGARRSDDGRRHAAQAVGVDRSLRDERRRRRAKRSAIRSEDLATVLVRFDGGAKGCVSVGQVCAGHKNDLWFEVNGRQASLRWQQERQNELWIGRRDAANAVLAEGSVAARRRRARAYAHLPGGHQEAWADAFCNVMRDIYGFIAAGKRPGRSASAGLRHLRRRVSFGVRRRRDSREPPARRRVDRRCARREP